MNNARASLFKKTPTASAANQSPATESFVMVVERYDLESTPAVMHGVQMETGATVAVSLRDVAGINKGDFKRPEIADFAKPRKFQNDPGVLAGGTVYVKEAVKTEDGQYSARWISALSHEEGEAEVLVCSAHYEGPRKGRETRRGAETTPGTVYSRVTLLCDGEAGHLSDEMRERLGFTKPFVVTSVADLRNELLVLLEQDMGAGIRLKSGDEFDALSLHRGSDNTVSLEDTVDEFLANKLPDGLDELLASDDVLLEVIPYRTVFMGKKSAADTMKRMTAEEDRVAAGGKQGANLIKVSRYNGVDANGRNQQLFGKTLLAVRISAPDADGNKGLYFTVVEPLFGRGETLAGIYDAVSYAQTENFAPAIVYAGSSKPAAAAEPAAAAAAQPAAAEPAAAAAAQPAAAEPAAAAAEQPAAATAQPAAEPVAAAEPAATAAAPARRFTSNRR